MLQYNSHIITSLNNNCYCQLRNDVAYIQLYKSHKVHFSFNILFIVHRSLCETLVIASWQHRVFVCLIQIDWASGIVQHCTLYISNHKITFVYESLDPSNVFHWNSLLLLYLFVRRVSLIFKNKYIICWSLEYLQQRQQ